MFRGHQRRHALDALSKKRKKDKEYMVEYRKKVKAQKELMNLMQAK